MSDDLVERVARAIEPLLTIDEALLASPQHLRKLKAHRVAQAAIAAIDIPAQREDAARQALEAAAAAAEGYMADCLEDKDVQRGWPRTFARNLTYGRLIRAIDPACFKGEG